MPLASSVTTEARLRPNLHQPRGQRTLPPACLQDVAHGQVASSAFVRFPLTLDVAGPF